MREFSITGSGIRIGDPLSSVGRNLLGLAYVCAALSPRAKSRE